MKKYHLHTRGAMAALLAMLLVPAALADTDAHLARMNAALEAPSAEEAVGRTTDEVLDFIETSRSYANDDKELFFSQVETLIDPMIDFRRFARNVMGPYYKRATPEQRDAFAMSFKRSLVRTYALALTQFSDGNVEVLPPRRPPRTPDEAKVTQQIRSGSASYMVVYDMRRRDGRWSLRNMIIEGLNVGITFKEQFASAVKSPTYAGDVGRVIAAWSDIIGARGAEAEASTAPAGGARGA